MTDEELIRRFVTRRDERGFRQLYATHTPAVYGFIRRRLVPVIDITGEELSDTGDEVPAGAADGPAPRGYFIVAASSAAEARRIAVSCPHMRHGGRIVIRPIVSGS